MEKNGLSHIFLGIAEEDIKVGDIVTLTTNTEGIFSVSKAKASCVYEEGTTMRINNVKNVIILEQEPKPIDRCKRMVVVKKEFSNEEE